MNSILSGPHRRAIGLLSVAAFASSASARLCDPMLPELTREFAASATETAYVVSGFSVAYGLFQIFFGPLGDRFGKYRLIALTALVSTLGSAAAMLSRSLDLLIVSRFLTGVSAAGIIPLSMAWIGDTVPYEHRQATLARFLFGQIMGVIGGQFIGGFFSDTLGWRWAFAFLAVVYLAIGAMVLAESYRNAITYPLPASGQRDNRIFAQVAAVLKVGWARVVIATVFLEGMTVFGALAFVPSYLHERFGLSLTMAGGVIGLFGVGGLSYISFARYFVSRLGEVGLALCGGVLMCLAWALLAFSAYWFLALVSSYVIGLGFYMLHNTLQTNATQMAPQVRGTAVSMFASALFLGQSFGVTLAANGVAHAGPVVVFGAAACLLPVIGSVFSALLRRRHRAAS